MARSYVFEYFDGSSVQVCSYMPCHMEFTGGGGGGGGGWMDEM